MFSFTSFTQIAILGLLTLTQHVQAESHTVSFENKCGFGTPMLIGEGSVVLSSGANYTVNDRLIGALAYLQNGNCGMNGENCTIVETTLFNNVSGTDINLIPPHSFSVTSGFKYFNGCEGIGADCNNPDCPTAAHNANDDFLQTLCPVPNVDLLITFCE